MSVNIQTADGLKRLLDEEHSNNTGIHITDAERCTWNSKSDFSGNYNDLDNKPNIIDDGSNNLAIADTDGNIIFKVDADGTHTTALEIDGEDIVELINSNGFSGDYNDLKNKPNIIDDGSGKLEFADEAGNVVARIDEDGFETTKVTAKEAIIGSVDIKQDGYDKLTVADEAGNIVFEINSDGQGATNVHSLQINGKPLTEFISETSAKVDVLTDAEIIALVAEGMAS